MKVTISNWILDVMRFENKMFVFVCVCMLVNSFSDDVMKRNEIWSDQHDKDINNI